MQARYLCPTWLYEALPLLYALAGLFTLLSLRSALGLLSGLLLVAAGWQVWRMRYAYRRQQRRARPAGQAGHRHTRHHALYRNGRAC